MSTAHSPPRPGGRRLRGVVAASFAAMGAVAALVWVVVAPELPTDPTVVLVDEQTGLLVVTAVTALVGLVTSFTAFGRSMVLVASMALVAQAAAAVAMALGGAGVVGRAGTPSPLTVWPIVVGFAGVAGVAVLAWRTPVRRHLERRHLVAAAVGTVVGITAVGLPDVAVYAVGDPGGLARRAVPFVVDLVPGVLVALLATAPLRTSRTAAVGQALAALAILGTQTWGAWASPPPELVRHPPAVAVAVAATLVVAAVGASPEPATGWGGTEDAFGADGEGLPPVGTERRTSTAVLDPVPATPRARVGDRDPVVPPPPVAPAPGPGDRDPTDVIEQRPDDAASDGPSHAGSGAVSRTDRTEVIDPVGDPTDVIDVRDDRTRGIEPRDAPRSRGDELR